MFLRCHSRKKNGKRHRDWSAGARRLQRDAGRVAGLVKVREPKADEPVNRETFVCTFDRSAWKKAMDRDGCYILRAYLPPEQMPESLGSNKRRCCGRGTRSGFTLRKRSLALKSDLGLRPIHHPIEKRVEAHIFVAFLAYCLTVTLRMKLDMAAPGLTPGAVLKSLSAIQLVDVHVPIADGRKLVMSRYTEPDMQQAMILEKLNLHLPKQPPPRIRSGEIIMPPPPST